MMITIRGQLTEQDYLQAQQLHMQLTGWARLLPYATILLWIVGFIFAGLKAIQGTPSFFLALVPATLFILITPLTNRSVLPRQIKRLFQQNKEVSAPMEMEFSEEGMKFTNSFGHNARPWSYFVKWKEGEQGFLLYHADQVFNLIPKRLGGAPEALSFVREQLQKNAVPVAGTSSIILRMRLLFFIVVLFAIGTMVMTEMW